MIKESLSLKRVVKIKTRLNLIIKLKINHVHYKNSHIQLIIYHLELHLLHYHRFNTKCSFRTFFCIFLPSDLVNTGNTLYL